MRPVPDWFAEQLRLEHAGRLRIRWSPIEQNFQVESKVAPGTPWIRPPKIKDQRTGKVSTDTAQDGYVRARDGYQFVCALEPTRQKRCPKCHNAVMEFKPYGFKHTTCPLCQKGSVSGWWEFTDQLLQHLRYIDPDRGGIERVFKDLERDEERAEATKQRDFMNKARDVASDMFSEVYGIQSVGYTGKEFRP